MTNRDSLRDIIVLIVLVAIGVFGRWAQPVWSFSPIAAVTIFAGFYFSRWPIAAMVPVASLAISDQLLPAHDHVGVLLTTYVAMVFPVVLGRMLRHDGSRTTKAVRWAFCGLVPATLFYLVTNFAVWAFKSNYEKTWAGLAQCYWAAVPFYRWMLAGDVFYLVLIFGCYALAGARSQQTAPQGSTSPRQGERSEKGE